MRLKGAAWIAVAGWSLAGSAAVAAEKGQVGLQLNMRPARDYPGGARELVVDVGTSYQFSERFSLRPGFALSYSKLSGWGFELGATPLFHPRPGARLSPYFGAGFRYHHRPLRPELDVTPPAPDPADSRRFVTFSAVAGVEYSLSRRLSVFTEVQGLASTGRHHELAGVEWRRASGRDLRPVVGLTLKLR